MSNSFTKLYSQLSDNSLKSSMMKMFNGAFSEIAKENILSKLSRDSFDKLTGNDKNAKIEETFSVAISFGKSLCEKTSQKTDKNARIAHIMKTDNNPNLINCFCIYLIDYVENNVNKNNSYVIAALTQDNAGVDDYIEIQEQINLIYGKKILRVIPFFDKIEKKPEPKIPDKFSDVYSNSETSQGVVCLKCGKENDEDSDFCCFCGSAIGGTVIPEKRQPQLPTPQPVYSSSQPKSENRCPRCNKVNRAISKFCLNCGAPLENVEKPEPIMDEGIELVSIDGEEESSPAQEAYELNTDNWFDENQVENAKPIDHGTVLDRALVNLGNEIIFYEDHLTYKDTTVIYSEVDSFYIKGVTTTHYAVIFVVSYFDGVLRFKLHTGQKQKIKVVGFSFWGIGTTRSARKRYVELFSKVYNIVAKAKATEMLSKIQEGYTVDVAGISVSKNQASFTKTLKKKTVVINRNNFGTCNFSNSFVLVLDKHGNKLAKIPESAENALVIPYILFSLFS